MFLVRVHIWLILDNFQRSYIACRSRTPGWGWPTSAIVVKTTVHMRVRGVTPRVRRVAPAVAIAVAIGSSVAVVVVSVVAASGDSITRADAITDVVVVPRNAGLIFYVVCHGSATTTTVIAVSVIAVCVIHHTTTITIASATVSIVHDGHGNVAAGKCYIIGGSNITNAAHIVGSSHPVCIYRIIRK